MTRRPPALRTRLLLTVLAGVGVTLIALVAAFVMALRWELDRDVEDALRTRADAELATVRISDGRVVPARDAGGGLGARAWVFQDGALLVGPRVPADIDAAAASLAARAGAGAATGDGPRGTRLLAVPIRDAGRRVGTVVAGVSIAPYRRVERRAAAGAVGLALLAIVAVGIAASAILRAALRPVSRMTRDAAAWSERDLDQRFDLGPPHDELTALAATLDGLLDRLAAGLRRERHLTAEISHELRTPLAGIRAEVDLALRRPREGPEYRDALRAIGDGVTQIEATIDTLLHAARQEGGAPRGTAAARDVAEAVAEACEHLARRRGIAVSVEGDGGRIGVDAPVGVRILQPIVENACRHAVRAVTVSVGPSAGGGVALTVRDDGPGVAPGEEEAIFESGRRGTAGEDHGGAGLGLALARRLARASGGDVTAGAGPGGQFTAWLPGA